MEFGCSKCSKTFDTEKGANLHITKMHGGDAKVKTPGYHKRSEGRSERQHQHYDSARPCSSRGRGRGSSHGMSHDRTYEYHQRSDTTDHRPQSSRGGRRGSSHGMSHDRTYEHHQRSDTTDHRPQSSRGGKRGSSHEMSYDRTYEHHQRSDTTDHRPQSSRRGSRGPSHGMPQGREFEQHQRTDSYSSHSSRGGKQGPSHGMPQGREFEQHQRTDSYSSHSSRGGKQGSRGGKDNDHTQRYEHTDTFHENFRRPSRDSSFDDRPGTSSRDAKSSIRGDYNKIMLPNKSVSEVSVTVNRFIEDFQKQLEETSGLKFEKLNSGSYYDKTKNNEPDEFDFMFSPKHLSVKPDYRGATEGYCKLEVMEAPDEIKESSKTGKYLDPFKLKAFIFRLFDKVFRDSSFRKGRQVKKKERSGDSPAYTIYYRGIPGKPPLDIDLVPAIKIVGWPDKARPVNPTWTNDSKMKARCMECYHAVAKTCPDDVRDANMLWRLSFSWAEKELIKHANDGDTKSCRKKVFRLLKGTLEDTKQHNPDKIKKFCSYHLKMFMLGQFDDPKYQSDSEDSASLFPYAIRQLLQALGDGDRRVGPKIKNYFIPTDNVLRTVPQQELNLVCTSLRDKLAKL